MLVEATREHLREMMGWFPDAQACRTWGGPEFRFPFTETTFSEDSRQASLPSYALVGEAGELLAFGQFYLRAGRCHLGRLAVAPALQGRGLGRRLVVALAELGCRTLGCEECSLFVVPENEVAVGLYEKLGFSVATYPEEGPGLLGFEYRVVPLVELERRAPSGSHRPGATSGERSVERLPIGVLATVGLFLFGVLASATSFLALLFPGTPLRKVWRLKPDAHEAFLAMGPWAIVLLLVVCVAAALAAAGLLRRARWGHHLAVGILSVNLLGDTANALVRGDLRTLIGLPIGGALIVYLLRPRVRVLFGPRATPSSSAG